MPSSTPTDTYTYTLSKLAYLKLILHAAKYPSLPVNGCLIGTKDTTKKTVEISDAVPLFHNGFPLVPMLETALEQIEVYCQRIGSSMVGYYCANELYSDTQLSTISAKVATKIDDAVDGGSVVLLVNNSKLKPGTSELAVLPFTSNYGSWKSLSPTSLITSTPVDSLTSSLQHHISQQTYHDVVDFDTHLDIMSMLAAPDSDKGSELKRVGGNVDWLRNAVVGKAVE
ncbi:ER membrane protein complex subunit 8 [Quaeritorhiza haematococci]|nr:ER membrane protein complex subunit 8 [Quaeritorhiza haematococci]